MEKRRFLKRKQKLVRKGFGKRAKDGKPYHYGYVVIPKVLFDSGVFDFGQEVDVRYSQPGVVLITASWLSVNEDAIHKAIVEGLE